ncbi:hypothetical protein [Candidatus Uabimicrobium sp. HlEnr_7]|uniref:hypothetical protein n=1 Tax=Candidatus Uabimicrobium helgolandensis TaxID=3095367 RepID=UPI003556C522
MKESKEILKSLRENIVQNQVNAYVEDNNCCQICNISLKKKGHNEIKFRTLFGKLSIESPRFRNCKCIEQRTVSFSSLPNLINERVSPELQFMESK